MNTNDYARFKGLMNEAEEGIITSELNGTNIHDMDYEQLIALIASFNVKLGALKTLMDRLYQAKSELLSKNYYEKTGIKCGTLVQSRDTVYSVAKLEWFKSSDKNTQPIIWGAKLKKDGTPSKSSQMISNRNIKIVKI